MDELKSRQTLVQGVGDFRMPGEKIIPRQGTPCAQCLEILFECSDHSGVIPYDAADR